MTREKFEAYISVQKEGLTNMLDIPIVIGLANKFSNEQLTKEDCLEIIKNYSIYKKLYSDENTDRVCEICLQPEDEDGRCGCTNKDSN